MDDENSTSDGYFFINNKAWNDSKDSELKIGENRHKSKFRLTKAIEVGRSDDSIRARIIFRELEKHYKIEMLIETEKTLEDAIKVGKEKIRNLEFEE